MQNYGIILTKEEESEIDRICKRIHERVATEPMTPRQRFEAVYRGEEPDRIPIQVCALGLHAAANYGVRPSALYTAPKTSLFSYLTHLERFGYDTPSAFRFSTGEAEFGMEVEYTDSAVPFGKKGKVETVADLVQIKFFLSRKAKRRSF